MYSFVEIAAETMAANAGFYTPAGTMPSRTLDPNVCAVCGNRLLLKAEEEAIIEKTCRLSCNHEYVDLRSYLLLLIVY